jgi:hypothetical protein
MSMYIHVIIIIDRFSEIYPFSSTELSFLTQGPITLWKRLKYISAYKTDALTSSLILEDLFCLLIESSSTIIEASK